ncbi:jg5283 [Pararge aegeria aegeria]|uniref:Jg5283 protein n=1 Tax=Pararge aegeria aegeria TaxID=348720 RepID=A0A8S4R7I0_9NEOP|nr:jg5283 [Pararge aegeria aegeria]
MCGLVDFTRRYVELSGMQVSSRCFPSPLKQVIFKLLKLKTHIAQKIRWPSAKGPLNKDVYRYMYGMRGLDGPSPKESKTAKNFPIPNRLPRGPCGVTGLNEDSEAKSGISLGRETPHASLIAEVPDHTIE